jgi:hypothetical protein
MNKIYIAPFVGGFFIVFFLLLGTGFLIKGSLFPDTSIFKDTETGIQYNIVALTNDLIKLEDGRTAYTAVFVEVQNKEICMPRIQIPDWNKYKKLLIQESEARPLIGKEIEIGVIINLKNDIRHVELVGVLLNVINGKEFLYNIELLDANDAGYYLVLDTEYQGDPLLVPCKSVTYIRRRNF